MEHHGYMTPETAAKTILPQLSSDSHIIVTGQIGCGKTTLSREIGVRLELSHLHIDDFNDDADPLRAVADAMNAINGGWVAEANVWQIPQAVWEASDLVIFLDYANAVHYRRIVRRCFRSCIKKPTWANIRFNIGYELEHLKIVFLYADENREDWQERGGITDTATPVIRSASPNETDMLLTYIRSCFTA